MLLGTVSISVLGCGGSTTSEAVRSTAGTSEPVNDVPCLTVPELLGDNLAGVEPTHFLSRPLYPVEGWYAARTVQTVGATGAPPGSTPGRLRVRFDNSVAVRQAPGGSPVSLDGVEIDAGELLRLSEATGRGATALILLFGAVSDRPPRVTHIVTLYEDGRAFYLGGDCEHGFGAEAEAEAAGLGLTMADFIRSLAASCRPERTSAPPTC